MSTQWDGRVERLEDGKLVRAEIDGEKILAEHMDAGDGVIVFAASRIGRKLIVSDLVRFDKIE